MKKPDSPACPTCGKAESADSRPFCSERCRDVDLNRWLSGAYAIPAVEEPDPDEAETGRARLAHVLRAGDDLFLRYLFT